MRKIPKPIAFAGYTAAAIMIAAGGVFFAQSAGAVVINDDPDGGFSLDANPYPFSDTTFSPGSTADWLVTARLVGSANSPLTVQFEYSGLLATDPDGLDLRVQECAVPWTGSPATCVAPSTIYNGPYASAPVSVQNLGTLVVGVDRYFLMNFSLPDPTPDSMQGQDAFFRFIFTATGDSETVTNLPRTGGVDLVGPLLLGGGLVLGGLILARQRVGKAAVEAAQLGQSGQKQGVLR